MVPTSDDLASNILLGTLKDDDRRRLAPQMKVMDLTSHHVLQQAGDEVVNTWFPCGGAMAAFCIATDDDSTAVEVALVGSEGAIGGIVSNGHVPAYATARVRHGGRFLRIKTTALEQAKLDSIALRHWFSRYSDCLLAQVFQTSACNATHTITQRTAKWLLAAMSRTQSCELQMTHEQLADVLGVGRTFVTRIISRLRQEGTIETRRGVFIVKNEQVLRDTACGCTTAIEEHFDTVMHGIYPSA
ncbi:Crp/Fnr family transcriptional regulator [Aureimonas mangrovi]|uniref:Crp/Fnr family transcriptional regulator n=1 Tax=Aureimonas mangrovi TaxID=2758041 RepID=UPI001FE8FDFD|nr:Crp/Fnr family transcriptional regulator [Aureimonas mangrovi]